MKLELANQEKKLRALRVQLVEIPGGVILKRGRAEIKIGGARAAQVAQVVILAASDGATTGEICELFAAPDRPAVESLIQDLQARRILLPGDEAEFKPDSLESNLDIFYWHFDQQTEQVITRLNSRRVAIIGVNCISRRLVDALAAVGMKDVEVVDYPLLSNLRLFDEEGELAGGQWPESLKSPRNYKEWLESSEPASLDCLVATSDFGGLQLMRTWNEFCVQRNYQFMPVVLQDLIGYVGPLIVPGETACFECLRARQNSHMPDPETERATESLAFEGQVVAGFHPSMASILGDIAAVELTRFLGGWMPARSVGTLIEVNMLAMEIEARKVLKVPRCPVCSALNTRSSTSLNRNVFVPGHPLYT